MSFKFDFQLVRMTQKERKFHTDEKDDDEEITQVPQVPTSLPEATSSSKPSYKITLDELVSLPLCYVHRFARV